MEFYRYLLPTLLLLAILINPAIAQEPASPIGVVSLVWGEVTVKHADADYNRLAG